ncbi:MAG: glutamate-5-semialdehyde dehydrogenase [bacterium]|jgi:glutamate-5-semialdehyde dehydrogenase|nr:glutamate-5-semialdehyde dehydrogenase [bacterium]MDD4558209.1 glutamate-5-semialdehyde dehydrogenase [bacterium]
MYSEVRIKASAAKEAAVLLGTVSTAVKNAALQAIADALRRETAQILEANRLDMEAAGARGLSGAFIERLMLDESRVGSMSRGLEELIGLADPVGEVVDGRRLSNGLEIVKTRVPLGVVGIIYESRPNVTIDAAGLCLKAGNAVMLRGGSEAINSNKALVGIATAAAVEAGMPKNALQLIETTNRAAAEEMMGLTGYIDVLIPRGGAGLIRTVIEKAKVPIIETGVGNCHTYIDAAADLNMAARIAFNAKVQRPGVCNAMETLLIHRSIADRFLPDICHSFRRAGIEIRGDETVCALCKEAVPATEEDWYTEYLALTLSIKVVDDLNEAIAHIRKYGSGHSEAIVTGNLAAAKRFTREIDAAAVYVNASTRFTDGSEFGLGAEIGISTQKLHARGPMGLQELTSSKFIIMGEGQIRGGCSEEGVHPSVKK